MNARSVKSILVISGLALAILGASLFATAPRRQAGAVGGTGELVIPVVALRVESRTERERIEISGVMQPIRKARLEAEVDGRVVQIAVREHERVVAGGEILKLDDSIRVASVERAQAALLRAESVRRLAQIELDRLRRLRKKGVASQSELDVAANREREAAGGVGEAKAILAEAEVLLERTSIRAPFDGVLTNCEVEIGDRLGPGAPVGELIAIDRVEIELGVNESQIVALREQQSVELRADVYPGDTFAGQIRRVGSAIDERTRLFPVDIEIENPDERLLPGMVGDVTVEIGAADSVLRIPRQAMLEEFGLTYVFVIVESDVGLVVERRRVVVRDVAFRPTLVSVRDGLSAGERIVARDVRELADGALVSIEGRP